MNTSVFGSCPMTRKQKLLEKLADPASDRSWTYDTLTGVLESEGYFCNLRKGSHHTYRNGAKKITLPFRRGNLLPVYVKQVRELLIP